MVKVDFLLFSFTKCYNEKEGEYMLKREIIIASNNIKKNILKHKALTNIKIMTKKEFITNYFGSYKNEALYFLMKHYTLNYDVALKYLKYIYMDLPLIKPYYKALTKEKLLVYNPYFKENLSTITSYETLDKYMLKELNKFNLKIISDKNGNFKPKVFEFETQTEELTFVACDIIKKLNTVDINDIYIVGMNEEYKSELIRIFNLFKIPFNIDKQDYLYSSNIIQTFLKNLNQTKDITKSLEILKSSDLKNKLIDILNDLNFPNNIDTIHFNIIKETLKSITLPKKEVKNAVQIKDDITENNKHYYLIGLNQGIIPKMHKDDDIISDKEKAILGILTSNEKNKIEKDKLIHIIKTFPNLTLSYKLKDTFNTYYPSPIIDELNLEIKKITINDLNFSNQYNKLKLATLLDNYFNYNEINENMNILYNTYPDINYKTYNNKYKKINHQENKLTLSYTSLNNYALCPFKYYIKHILNLKPYEETFSILIGNLFHYCLSHLYEENFDLRKYYTEFLKEKEFSKKEEFYLKKLYDILSQNIEVIKWQDNQSSYKTHLTEKEIVINVSNNVKIKGIIDKINVNEKDITIVDYKTGNVVASLDNINYGLNMQLPTYIYLINSLNKYKINGFYLQTLLIKPTLDDKNDFKENLKLKGYTINDEEKIKNIDASYKNSEIIKAMKITSKGFSTFSKVLSEEDIDKIIEITKKNIDKFTDKILKGEFDINPKRIDYVAVSCPNCPFKDICFVTEEDILDLKNTKINEILGGEKDA